VPALESTKGKRRSASTSGEQRRQGSALGERRGGNSGPRIANGRKPFPIGKRLS
jgi:hypothetical protein